MTKKEKARLLNYLTKYTNSFERLMRKTYRAPTRARVHELRTTVRRIRAVLWLAEQASPHLSFGKLPSSLRSLGQILGKQRELDVAMRDASHYHLKQRKIKSLRDAIQRKLLDHVDPKQQKKISHQLQRAIKKLQNHPELDLSDGLAKLRERLRPWVRKTSIKNEDLHKLRIMTKKTRYALEAVGRSTPPLRNLQNLLGRGHDLEVLQSFFRKNKKIQADLSLKYKKAELAIRPTLRFAMKQFDNELTVRSAKFEETRPAH